MEQFKYSLEFTTMEPFITFFVYQRRGQTKQWIIINSYFVLNPYPAAIVFEPSGSTILERAENSCWQGLEDYKEVNFLSW